MMAGGTMLAAAFLIEEEALGHFQWVTKDFLKQ